MKKLNMVKKRIVAVISVVFVFISCNKEKIDSLAIKISEVVSPNEVPELYKSSTFIPKVKILNVGDLLVSSFLLAYEVDITNTSYSRKPGQEI